MNAIDPLNPWSQPTAADILTRLRHLAEVEPGGPSAPLAAAAVTSEACWHGFTGEAGSRLQSHATAASGGTGAARAFCGAHAAEMLRQRLADRFFARSPRQIAGEAAGLAGLDTLAGAAAIAGRRLAEFIAGARATDEVAATVEAAARRLVEEKGEPWPPVLAELVRVKPLVAYIMAPDESGNLQHVATRGAA